MFERSLFRQLPFLIPAALVLSLAACDGSGGLSTGTEDDSTSGQPADTAGPPQISAIIAPPERHYQAPGTALDSPLRFRVVDQYGRGMGGIKVAFEVPPPPYGKVGGGSVEPDSAVTDSLGYAQTVFTLGSRYEVHEVWANVPAVAFGSIFRALPPPPTLTLERDTLDLPVGCTAAIPGKLFYPDGAELVGQQFEFRLTDSSSAVLERALGMGTIGASYGGQRRVLFAFGPGTTRVVASYQGAADTTVVRMVRHPGYAMDLRFYPELAVAGDTVVVRFNRSVTDCPVQHLQASEDHPRPVTIRALDAQMATVLDPVGQIRYPRVATFETKVVVGARGEARIAAEYLGQSVAGTIRVGTLTVTPGDTTVFVGDTVTFTARSRAPDGTERLEDMGGSLHLSDLTVGAPVNGSSEPSLLEKPIRMVALKPGSVVASAFVLWKRRTLGTIRVVERP